MMSFLHSQRVAQFRRPSIVFTRGFRSPPAYSTFHGVLHLAQRTYRFPSPRAMATKGKRDDDKPAVHSADTLRALLSSAVTSYESAEVALAHIMETHNINMSSVERMLTKDCTDASFSTVKYKNLAPLVGLEPYLQMRDIETFGLHHSRIPTGLFKSIVQDIDAMMMQYGPPNEHEMEEATSRFLSPIFNHLIPIFGYAFRNSTTEGCITTKDRVEYYFKMIGFIAILFIETNPKIGSSEERLDTIAQVIAKCYACNWDNAQQGLCAPVYGILFYEDIFEFFLYDGAIKPVSLKRGLGPNNTPTSPRRFQFPNPRHASITHPFIDALRPICEVIFDSLLSGYVSSLKAYHNHSINNNAKEGQQRSVDKWEEAMKAAIKALQYFRDAETKRQMQLTYKANLIVEEAMTSLKHSVDLIPSLYKPKPKLIMSDWDDEKIEKV